jgi:uncharacterized protein YaiL (DUF2058 family)
MAQGIARTVAAQFQQTSVAEATTHEQALQANQATTGHGIQ